MSLLSISSPVGELSAVSRRMHLPSSASEVARAQAAHAAQSMVGALRVPENVKAVSSMAGLTESLNKTQQLMDYIGTPISSTAVAESSASGAAGDSTSNQNKEQSSESYSTPESEFSGILQQNLLARKNETRIAENNKSTRAAEAYQAVQRLDDSYLNAFARAKSLGLHISVLA